MKGERSEAVLCQGREEASLQLFDVGSCCSNGTLPGKINL